MNNIYTAQVGTIIHTEFEKPLKKYIKWDLRYNSVELRQYNSIKREIKEDISDVLDSDYAFRIYNYNWDLLVALNRI